MTCPVVFKPDSLIEYFKKGAVDRQLLCTDELTTASQKFMEQLTKTFPQQYNKTNSIELTQHQTQSDKINSHSLNP